MKPELLVANLARESSQVIPTYIFFDSILLRRKMCQFSVIIGSQAEHLSFAARTRRPSEAR